MKTKEQILDEILSVIQNADNESQKLNDFTLEQLTDYFYELQQVKNCTLHDTSSSWLDNHVLNKDSKIDGIIIKHHSAPETYGGVAVKTNFGNFALIKRDQIEAVKNIGKKVIVQPHKEYYGTVTILQDNKMNFYERLLKEREELEGRISRLTIFLGSDKALKINKHQLSLLTIQLSSMHTYYNILVERIDLIDNG